MRIAQISLPEQSVVSYLAEELLRLGHDVALLANGDPVTTLQQTRARADEFDVLHFHLGGSHFPAFRDLAHKTVTTLHGRLDLPEIAPLFHAFAEMPLVSISDRQRSALPAANWLGTVHPGLPAGVCPLNPVAPRGAGRYLAFLGSASPEDGLLRAVEIAQRSGIRLRVAAEVGEAAKPGFLGNAVALLYPIDWPEPFGLAMIEAMSCGTPVIGWRRGAVPEVVDHGVTGFVVETIDEAVAAVPAALRLQRTRVRERFEQRFSARRMARDYLAMYRTLNRSRAIAAA